MGMSNKDRAEAVEECLDLFCDNMGLTVSGDSEDKNLVLGDFLCDLFHYCGGVGIDLEKAVKGAKATYLEELLEEVDDEEYLDDEDEDEEDED